jgi:fructose-1-phosphate kinase PfkB-like protein
LNPGNLPSLADSILQSVSTVCPIDASLWIDGKQATATGLIRPVLDPSQRPDWPESFWLLQNGCPRGYTLEAPSDWPLPVRAQALQQAVITAAATAQFLTISGSLPPGVDAQQLRQLIDAVPATCTVLLDTSGAPLQACLDAPIGLLKINASELAQAIGTPITTHAEAVIAARQVCASGPRAVVITLGAAGAIAVDASGAWYVAAPTIHAVSPVGSGDCTLAGIAVALQRGNSLAEALRCGVAAGSANALQPHAGLFTIDQYTTFLHQLTITPLA